jgi:hypothetical protein
VVWKVFEQENVALVDKMYIVPGCGLLPLIADDFQSAFLLDNLGKSVLAFNHLLHLEGVAVAVGPSEYRIHHYEPKGLALTRPQHERHFFWGAAIHHL